MPVFEQNLILLHPELILWCFFLYADGAHHDKLYSHPTHPLNTKCPSGHLRHQQPWWFHCDYDVTWIISCNKYIMSQLLKIYFWQQPIGILIIDIIERLIFSLWEHFMWLYIILADRLLKQTLPNPGWDLGDTLQKVRLNGTLSESPEGPRQINYISSYQTNGWNCHWYL